MAYGICRIQKLKAGAVGRSASHTSRKRETPNADPEKQHIRIIGQPDNSNTPDLETLVRQRIREQTIRKNAVLAVEFLLTASPEYFRPDDPGRAGHYEEQRLYELRYCAQWHHPDARRIHSPHCYLLEWANSLFGDCEG